MCPPESIPPAAELNEYSTDEAIFESLMRLKSGCSLPFNVVSGVDPYQFTPSNLPAGMWYFWSGSKTDTENGFWRPTGETCEIYSCLVICLRKTVQFYQGAASDGQKTNLMMQEYTTNDKYSSKLDPRALYRVFLPDGGSISSGRFSESKLLVKNLDDVAGPSAVADRSQDQPAAVANQSPDRLLGDYVSMGDYLELDDLAIPLSRTTSADSSCMTWSITSEDLFDSDALLCELGDDDVDHDSGIKLNLSAPEELKEVGVQPTTSGIKLNLSAPKELKKVVMQPTTLGSLDKESKPCTGQTSKANPIPESEPGDRCKIRKVDTSSSSSSSSEGSCKEERKHRSKKRKIMKYLCFLGS